MFDNTTKFDFDDILIVPSEITDIKSRKEVNVYDENGMLPIFAAPMDTVVSIGNEAHFRNNRINSIIPRTEFVKMNTTDMDKLINRVVNTSSWVAVGLDEFSYLMGHFHAKSLMDDHPERILERDYYICIDIANGHLQKLDVEIVKWKKHFSNLHIMTGNVANPFTYERLSKIGVEYVRVGIGNGSGCLTTQQTAIGYPMASLINECYKISCTMNKPAKIVADGGFDKYSDIIKALHLGADAVMLGGIFNKALESCADTYMGNVKHESWTEPGKRINQYDQIYADMLQHGTRIFKKFRGMSTKEVQSTLKPNTDIKTSEGITRMNQVEYTLQGWTENFIDYMKSSMSYCNCRTLDEFIGMEQFVLITNNSLERFKK